MRQASARAVKKSSPWSNVTPIARPGVRGRIRSRLRDCASATAAPAATHALPGQPGVGQYQRCVRQCRLYHPAGTGRSRDRVLLAAAAGWPVCHHGRHDVQLDALRDQAIRTQQPVALLAISQPFARGHLDQTLRRSLKGCEPFTFGSAQPRIPLTFEEPLSHYIIHALSRCPAKSTDRTYDDFKCCRIDHS